MIGFRHRILLLVALLVVTSLIAVGFASSRLTRRELFEFLEEVEVGPPSPATAALVTRLAEAHGRDGDWRSAQEVLDAHRAEDQAHVWLVLDAADRPIAVAGIDAGSLRVARDARGALVLEIERVDESFGLVLSLDGAPLRVAGEIVARLYDFPRPEGPPVGSPELGVLRSVDRWLVVAVALVGVLALVAAWVSTRRLLRPLERLTDAARRMEQGTLGVRLAVEGDDEVAQLTEAFNAMSTSIARLEQARRRLVGDTAHELRTPLTALRCQLEAAQDGLMPLDAVLLGSLYEEARQLERLVDDLQDLALAESGQMPLDLADVDLEAEIVRAVHTASVARTDGPTLHTQLGGVPIVRGDATRLRQVLGNLLTNALTHSRTDGQVEVASRWLDGTSDRPSWVEVTVSDDGPGVDEAERERVFERFYRIDPARGRASGGAGLGLAISKHLVQLHGGEIGVRANPGGGAAFWFRLPVPRTAKTL